MLGLRGTRRPVRAGGEPVRVHVVTVARVVVPAPGYAAECSCGWQGIVRRGPDSSPGRRHVPDPYHEATIDAQGHLLFAREGDG